jgi:hypothetical protein
VLLGDYNLAVLWATLAGLVTGVLIGFTSDYYTSFEFRPVIETARVSGSGAAINIITGYSYGLIGIVPSIVASSWRRCSPTTWRRGPGSAVSTRSASVPWACCRSMA